MKRIAILALLTCILLIAAASVSLATVINVPSDQTSIQAAITVAAPDDTIQVAAGSYTETGQILIDKNLTITGAGAGGTIVMKAEDTSVPGGFPPADGQGWILVKPGCILNLSDLTLDGTGAKIHLGIITYGTTTVERCDIINIGYQKYYGRGIGVYGGTTSVKNCVFWGIERIGVHVRNSGASASIENSAYTGKGAGDWLDYAFEASGGGVMSVTNCTVTACTGVALSDGSTSAGILATTYWGPGTSATITDSTIALCTDGIAMGYLSDDTAAVTAHNNLIYGNARGADNVCATTVMDAENNWWGNGSGPRHSSNPSGIGDVVTDNVDFDPWVTALGQSLDFVDIGTPSSESGHNLKGWGPIEPDTHGGGWGGMGSGTAVYSFDQKCRPTWFAPLGIDTPEASVDLSTGTGTQDTLVIHALDGLGDDGFEVYVGPAGGQLSLVYTYADPLPAWDSPEYWTVHVVDLTQIPDVSPLRVEIVSTAPAWQYFDPYGQLGIDWIEIFGYEEIPPTMFWKDHNSLDPGGYMPDIDQKQDFNGDHAVDMHYCAPVAEANSLWWLDKMHHLGIFEFPEIGMGYRGGDVNNDGIVGDVKDLVQDLAVKMGTNVQQPGTLVMDEQRGIDEFLMQYQLFGMLYEHTAIDPEFSFIEAEVERCQDVKLDIGFWHVEDVTFDPQLNKWLLTWRRVGGHAVTVAGVDSANSLLALSDPYFDAAENSMSIGVIRPEPQGHAPHPGISDVHNNEDFASHDIYKVVPSISPGGIWALQDYPVAWPDIPGDLEYNNGPEEVVVQEWDTHPPVEYCMTFAEIEAAVIVSPVIPPIQTSIDPDHGTVGDTVLATVTGANFQQGATVKLVKGLSEIAGVVSSVTDSEIDASFNLAQATTGVWDVVVTNPDGGVCTQPVTFTVNEVSSYYVRIEQDDQTITKTGSWTTKTDPSHSATTQIISNTIGDSVSFTFVGTGISWISSRYFNRGHGKVYVDDMVNPVQEVDLYSSGTWQAQKPVFTATGLSSGTHTIKIEVAAKSGFATDNYCPVDAFDVYSDLNRTEESDVSVVKSGTWNPASDGSHSGTTQVISNTIGDYVTYTFTGDAITWVSSRYNNRGKAKVYIDDMVNAIQEVDLYSTGSWLAQQAVFTKTGLGAGSHTIKIEVSGKNPDSGGPWGSGWVPIDAFDTTDHLVRTEETSPSVTYSGSWSTQTDGSHSGTTQKVSNTIGDYASFTFTGDSIALITSKKADRGHAKIYIDTVLQQEIDPYSSGYLQPQDVCFTRTGLGAGSHTIKVEVAAKSDWASGNYIAIDAFDVR